MKTPSLAALSKGLSPVLLAAVLAHFPAFAAEPDLPPYLVVDVSAGPDAASYPVAKLDDIPAGGWTDEHKTTKIVLRLVRPGTFPMQLRREKTPRQVTLTQPFYLGVFEVTQRQWELVRGPWPFCFTNAAAAATRPADTIGYSDIRGRILGHSWPLSRIVESDSFAGRLRARTGMMGFDIPTSAQWEYACSAGGSDPCTDVAAMARVRDENRPQLPLPSKRRPIGSGPDEGTAPVGSYRPNAWGFYDMLGNIDEWVRDQVVDNAVTPAGDLVDPAGPASASKFIRCAYRGGSYRDAAVFCSPRSGWGGGTGDEHGFRLCRELPPVAFTNAPSLPSPIAASPMPPGTAPPRR